MRECLISSIVCIAKNRAIGQGGSMIWHLPEDLKHFRRTTMGHPVIMGRKSYDSLGKPLPGRPNLVVSRQHDSLGRAESPLFKEMEQAGGEKASPQINEGPFLYKTIDEAIDAAKSMARELSVSEIFITGGGEIYRQTLPITQKLYLTVIDRDYEGDTFFPEIDWSQWSVESEDRRAGDPPFTFFTLRRK